MNKAIAHVICLFSTVFWGFQDLPSPFSMLDRDISAVERNINVLTGECYVSQDDLVVFGVEPISLRRIYLSGKAQERAAGWSFFPHVMLHMSRIEDSQEFEVSVAEPNGDLVYYKSESRQGDKELIFTPDVEKTIGYNYEFRDKIGARWDHTNNKLVINLEEKSAMLHAADGSVRAYVTNRKKIKDNATFYLLVIQKLNGNRIEYSYDNYFRVEKVSTHNPQNTKTYAWAEFQYAGDPKKTLDFDVVTSTNHKGQYRFWRKRRKQKADSFHLSWAQSSQRPLDQYDYQPLHKVKDPQVALKLLDAQEEVEFDYYHLSHNKLADGTEVHIPDESDTRYNRIKNVSFPMGVDGGMCSFCTLKYDPGKKVSEGVYDREGLTYLVDFLGHQAIFRSTPNLQMKEIEYHDKDHGLQKKRRFFWGEGQDKRRLVCRAYTNANDENLLAQRFQYDEHGNVVRETVYGNLTGQCSSPLIIDKNGSVIENGIEAYTKTYQYSENFHLLEQETEDNGLTKKYVYHPGTDILTAKYICNVDTPVIRYFYEYNTDGILITEVVDNGKTFDPQNLEGVTERKFYQYYPREQEPALGLPEKVIESFLDLKEGKQILLRKKVFTYDPNAKVIREDVYDDQDQIRYRIDTKYHSYDQIASQTTPMGQVHRYNWDGFFYPVYVNEANSPYTLHHSYDKMRRLIATVAEDAKGNEYTTKYDYDTYNQKVAEIDPQGRKIHYSYDSKGNCIRTVYPPVKNGDGIAISPSKKLAYDCWSNVISEEGKNGDTTFYEYNAYHQPTRILTESGREVQKIYSPRGELVRLIDEKGCETTFGYDLLGRVIEKKVYSSSKNLYSQEFWGYDAFHLTDYIDSTGVHTQYHYDGAGRKILESIHHENVCKRVIEYGYDSLGNCVFKRTFPGQDFSTFLTQLRAFDLDGNIVEQWEENEKGEKTNSFSFTYDNYGNKTKILRYTAKGAFVNLYEYDEKNRPTKHVDPEGLTTTHEYNDFFRNELDQYVTEKFTKYPNGDCERFEYDTLERVVSLEKKAKDGKILKKEEYLYDLDDNKTFQRCYVFERGEQKNIQETRWEYGHHKELLRLIEFSNTKSPKVTRYSYDMHGNLVEITKPDGVKLCCSFDSMHRLKGIYSTDGSIHYQYSYNSAHQLIQVTNVSSGHYTYREYDAFGNVIQEDLESGKVVCRQYDGLDRCTNVTIPGVGSIDYVYDTFHIQKVVRKDNEGQELYSHSFSMFNDFDLPLRQELIHGLGRVETSTDLLGRNLDIRTPYSYHTVKGIDSYGYVTHMSNIFSDTYYTYDDMHQLTMEKGLVTHKYDYDNQYNRIQKNASVYQIDQCNQLVSTPQRAFVYDRGGNVAEQIDLPFHYEYHYDALGRLSSVKIRDIGEYYFSYDGFNRRMSSRFVDYEKNDYQELGYLFVGDTEIGSFDNDGIRDLKILSMHNPKMPSLPIALEIENKTYAPLVDLQGNITHLVDVHTRKIAEMYHFTAFGEEVIFDGEQKRITRSALQNPWRYQSKRHEMKVCLIDFGKRFYSPDLGRWFTPDPAGFLDGSNLYQYVYNSPLYFLDRDGKNAITAQPPSILHTPELEIFSFTMLGSRAWSKDRIGFENPIQNIPASTVEPFMSIAEKTVRDMVQHAGSKPPRLETKDTLYADEFYRQKSKNCYRPRISEVLHLHLDEKRF